MSGGSEESSDQAGDDGVPVRVRYDWGEIAPSMAVVETVAAATGSDPTSIEPLYGSLDPGGLDTLVRSDGPEAGRGDVTVSFTFAGHLVTVHGTGEVVLRPARRTRGDGR